MTTPLERSLATTLEAEVRTTVEPDPEFFVAVHRRVRSRRRRRGALVAGCAAVLALAVGTASFVAVTGGDEGGRKVPDVAASTEPSLDLTTFPDFAKLKAPREVWPDAVSTLPSRLPDGGIYWAVDMLPGNRFLVLTGPKPADFQLMPANGFGRAEVAIFDGGRNTLTVLSDPDASAGTNSYINVYAGIVGDHAMWYAFATRNDKEEREVWSAPLSGGSPRKLVTLTADDTADAFAIVSSGVIWRLPTPGIADPERDRAGFYRIGPAGGTPEFVPGSEGYTWTSIGDWFTSDRKNTSGQLWNLATGEHRAWARNPAVVEMECGPYWCGGKNTADRPVIQKLDGSGYVELPAGVYIAPMADGRLAGVTYKETQQGRDRVLWDMTTGRAAGYYVLPTPTPISRGAGQTFSAFEQGDKVIVLTFSKIA